ncbi:MAG: gliding motility protein GldL [Crocinitomicaceae bacterium]|uniref:Gliding motility protein n=1 Tax=uncultured Flavobacteriia bacterium TaxID=212695 RepID=H6RGJ5_9BACT|nr:gliding motility protein GldL [uncultured bacterium]CCG00156.1 gliding motility protein gldL [uncultured Flavobacteriia bacterium]CCG00889.1 gliding motility protein [uncultured Flavobacteriia bacterium]|tara:strand:- start:6 stop:842 length:837 start_codon:yes stop_codon:yes gene_type:complete
MSENGTSFFESKTWKNIMKYVYGLGAAVVIMGALFKIMHWPGASEMLIVGLSTEALIFIMSVMEPVHLDSDWSRVFPELANTEGEGIEELEGVGLYDLIKSSSDEPGSQADSLANKLGDAGIDNALIGRLKDGMSNLADNATSLGSMSSATGATDQYVISLESASKSLDNLAVQYKESATSIAAISGEGNNFGPEMERLSSNIAALNNTYELQLKSSQDYIESAGQLQGLQESIKSVMSDLAASAGDTQIYRENMATLSQNLGDLNNVYGNMLKAMKS